MTSSYDSVSSPTSSSSRCWLAWLLSEARLSSRLLAINFFRFLLYVIPWEYLTDVRLLPKCVQLSVFVTPQDFKTSIRFTMGGDSPYEILPAAIVSTYHAFLLQVATRWKTFGV